MTDQNQKPQDDQVQQNNKALEDVAEGMVGVTRDAMNKITDVASINVGTKDDDDATPKTNEPLPDDHVLNKTNKALTDAVEGTVDATREAMNKITGVAATNVGSDAPTPDGGGDRPLPDDHPIKKTGQVLQGAAEGTIEATTEAMNKITNVGADVAKGTTEATREAMNKITDVGSMKIIDDEEKKAE